jgi:predicted transposase/invertase (TIGR01784 family)
MNDAKLIQFDYAIKYLLKNKSDYDIVEGFISAVLVSQGYTPVKIKALLDPESNRESDPLKHSIADVVVADEAGNKYIVEIDKSYTSQFLHKACFNTSRLIVDSLEEGQNYDNIKKVFHISLLYFSISQMKSALYHGKTIIWEVTHDHPIHIHLTDTSLQIFDAYDVFPEYFIISVPLFDDIIKQEIDEWLYVMKHSRVREDFKSPYMKKVAKRLDVLTMSPAELKAYNEYINKSLKERDYLISAEEKGREEEKIQIAQNMLAKNYPIEEIVQLTQLSKEEVCRLKK